MISWIRKLHIGIKVAFALFCVMASMIVVGLVALDHVFGMQDDPGTAALSPDHRYRATLHYKDGITFGFQHVILETTGRHSFGIGIADIVEADESGLLGVSWRDNHTLIVDYDATKHRDSMWDTAFMNQQFHWRDVQIQYHKTYVKDESKAPTTN